VNRLELIPEAIRGIIETAFVWAQAEVLAPGAGFVTTTVAQYLLGRQKAARGILRSELERAGAVSPISRMSISSPLRPSAITAQLGIKRLTQICGFSLRQ
jgi:hypothetical protein